MGKNKTKSGKKKKKLVLSIIGSMASGKSTLNRGLKDKLTKGEKPEEVVVEGKVHYTIYPKSGLCILGRVAENATGIGLDSVYSKLKVAGVTSTLEAALNDKRAKLIVIECALATMSWHRSFYKAGLRDKYEHRVVYLFLDYFNNLKRLAERIAKKEAEKGEG